MRIIFMFPSWLDWCSAHRLSWQYAAQLLGLLYRFKDTGLLQSSSKRGMSVQAESENGRDFIPHRNEASSRIRASLRFRYLGEMQAGEVNMYFYWNYNLPASQSG